jgi:hypothetical protein
LCLIVDFIDVNELVFVFIKFADIDLHKSVAISLATFFVINCFWNTFNTFSKSSSVKTLFPVYDLNLSDICDNKPLCFLFSIPFKYISSVSTYPSKLSVSWFSSIYLLYCILMLSPFVVGP